MKHILLSAIIITGITLFFSECKTTEQKADFIKIENGEFIKNGSLYHFVGTNYWYGASLAADTIGGNRARLARELDFLKQNGIDNLRVLVGAEGPDNQPFRVTPALVKQPGIYSPKLLEGLDYFLNELSKRDMVAILYLSNNWEWSGGFAQYLNWNGYGEFVNPNLDKFTWNDFSKYQKQFYSCDTCIKQLNQYVESIVTRTNSVNGKKYINDPAIMAWELANEPRPMTEDNFEVFKSWIKSTSELIKKLDPNHLITTGNEGAKGCSESLELFDTIHSYPTIDYLTFHIWVKNWGWYNYQKPDSTFPLALVQVQKYFDDHLAVARKLNKPLVLEEFGLARDNENFLPGTPTTYRDKYYEYIFGQVAKSVQQNNLLVGCNFWAFGGFTHPIDGQKYWKPGDPYSGDPPQEEQGLNSVYPTDTTTMNIIKKYNIEFGRINE